MKFYIENFKTFIDRTNIGNPIEEDEFNAMEL